MKKQVQLRRPFTFMAVGLIFWAATAVSPAFSAGAPTLGEAYPEFTEGVLKIRKNGKNGQEPAVESQRI